MVEFTTGSSKDFEVISTKRERIFDTEAIAQNVPEVLAEPLAWLPRLGTITPVEWDVTYGLGTAPSAVRLEWYLLMVDVDNLPFIGSIRDRAIWGTMQRWRLVGTDAGPIQTLQHQEVDFFNPETYNMTEMAAFTQRLAVVVIAHTDQNQTVDCYGVLTYIETVIQRVFGSDNWTFEDPDDSEFGQDWGEDASCDSSSS